ncbi:MAG: hypothetical protein R3C68_08745 [Myxococcota bacterium]
MGSPKTTGAWVGLASSLRASVWTAFLGILSVTGCKKLSTDLGNRPCQDNQCIAGYTCHPETGRCVIPIAVGCGAGELCPDTVTTGSPCVHVGSYIPCKLGAADCQEGCRTCDENKRWSGCSTGQCTLGNVSSCSNCQENCQTQVLNATALCGQDSQGRFCTYEQCLNGAIDADQNVQNGCECFVSNSGVEACDGVDNDCNGVIDDGASSLCAAPGFVRTAFAKCVPRPIPTTAVPLAPFVMRRHHVVSQAPALVSPAIVSPANGAMAHDVSHVMMWSTAVRIAKRVPRGPHCAPPQPAPVRVFKVPVRKVSTA